jgi:hypothetical protein
MKSKVINLKDQNMRSVATPELSKMIDQVDDEFEKIGNDVFDFESEDRVRKAGYTPQQVEDIAFKMKTENIKVGQIFQYGGKQLVLSPFKTVVPAQVYLTTIQDRLLEITSVPTEVEIAGLKKTINEFTSLSFLGLIKLAFKRLLTNLKGK